MNQRKQLLSLLKGPFSVLLITGAIVICTALAAVASTGSATWTTQADFETNAVTTGTPTTLVNIDTTTSPGDLKIGAWKDFTTTAVVTVVAGSKAYSTGVDRTSLAVYDPATAIVNKIALPSRVAGVVYNSTNNKLYVGQYNGNQLAVVDCSTDAVTYVTVGNGAYAAAYNSSTNKVYIANSVDQTVTILNGQDNSVLATAGPVIAGATAAAVDTAANTIYFTNKTNSYTSIIDGATNQVVKSFEVEAVANLLGGQSAGSVGLRVDAQTAQVGSADKMRLVVNHDPLAANQKIQLQLRSAADSGHLDTALYLGPDGTADTWYDLSASDANTVIEPTDGTQTTSLQVSGAFAQLSEIQLRLASDGITSPVVHSVSLFYQLVINASAGVGGSISPSGAVPVDFGASQTFTIAPDTGYHVSDVLVDGVSQGTITSYTFTNVTTGHTIAASFALNSYPIVATTGSGGSITPAGTVMVTYGADQAFAITADTGKHIADVAVDGVSQGAISSYTFRSVSAPHTIAATFAKNLNVIGIDTPGTVFTGQYVTVPVTVRNDGPNANGEFRLNYFWCPAGFNIETAAYSAILSTCSQAGTQYPTMPAAGTQSTFTPSILVPFVTSGNYYLGVTINLASTNVTQNATAGPQVAISYGPDLIVKSASLPTTAVKGAVTVPVTVQNQGVGFAPSFNVRYTICPTNTITTSCTSQGTQGWSTLAIGEERTMNASLTFSAAGTYYIGIQADYSKAVSESNETNNDLVAGPIVITD